MEIKDGVYLHFENMPISIKALTVKNDDDTFTILANPKHSTSRLIRSILHEISHIECDFDLDISANEIESLVRIRN